MIRNRADALRLPAVPPPAGTTQALGGMHSKTAFISGFAACAFERKRKRTHAHIRGCYGLAAHGDTWLQRAIPYLPVRVEDTRRFTSRRVHTSGVAVWPRGATSQLFRPHAVEIEEEGRV